VALFFFSVNAAATRAGKVTGPPAKVIDLKRFSDAYVYDQDACIGPSCLPTCNGQLEHTAVCMPMNIFAASTNVVPCLAFVGRIFSTQRTDLAALCIQLNSGLNPKCGACMHAVPV
jgi:hypothetical protein